MSCPVKIFAPSTNFYPRIRIIMIEHSSRYITKSAVLSSIARKAFLSGLIAYIASCTAYRKYRFTSDSPKTTWFESPTSQLCSSFSAISREQSTGACIMRVRTSVCRASSENYASRHRQLARIVFGRVYRRIDQWRCSRHECSRQIESTCARTAFFFLD